MARKSFFNISNGVISAIVLVSGIVLSILTQTIVNKITDVFNRENSLNINLSTSPFWAIGFIFIIPGFMGILATLIDKKGCFIAQMVFCIIAVVIVGISLKSGFGSPTTRTVFSSEICHIDRGVCICGNNYLTSLVTVGFKCDEVASVVHLGLGTDVMVLLGGVSTVVALFSLVRNAFASRQRQGQVIRNNTFQRTEMATPVRPDNIQPPTSPNNTVEFRL